MELGCITPACSHRHSPHKNTHTRALSSHLIISFLAIYKKRGLSPQLTNVILFFLFLFLIAAESKKKKKEGKKQEKMLD